MKSGGALTNFDLSKLIKHFKIPYFKGIFMRDQIKGSPAQKETGIINLDSNKGFSFHNNQGSHWTAYYIDGDKAYYYDSYGKIEPPDEFIKYIGNRKLIYNTDQDQYNNIEPSTCGYFCVLFLLKKTKL